MRSVFWFTGRSHSGKSTLTRRIKEILDKEFSVHILDGDELVNSLGRHNFRRFHHDDFIEKVLVLADSFSSKNKLVLVSIVTPKEKQRTRIREVLGDRYNELYIQCPKQVCYGRQNQRDRRVRKKIQLGVIRFLKNSLFALKLIHPFEVPLSPDLTIDNEHSTIEQSTKTCVTFINSKINEYSKNYQT